MLHKKIVFNFRGSLSRFCLPVNVNDMTEESKDNNYASCSKKVWGIYILITVVVIIILVAFVAQDDEERLFYSLMAGASAYVLRPSERTIKKYVLRLFGVSPPVESDKSE